MKNEKLIKEYLARAEEIIGERTPAEIAHDEVVVDSLNQGHPIEVALAAAAAKHPAEAIQWDDGNINDIAAHYDYLKEHARIMRKILKQKRR
jgi:hypothetical protein